MPASTITGLLFDAETLEAASLSDAKGREGGGTLCLEGPQADTLAAAEKKLTGELHLGLAAEAVLLGVAEVPTRERAEIQGMISLRAEEESPFPAEKTCLGWETWGDAGKGCRVVYALCSLAAVQLARDALASCRKRIDRVDVDVLGWLRLLVDAGGLPPEGAHLLFRVCGARTQMVLWRDGGPLLFRSLGDSRDWDEPMWVEEIAPALATARADWGVEGVEGLKVWHDGEAPAWSGPWPCGLPGQCYPLKDLGSPAVGIARRGRDGGRIDLLPPQWHALERERRRRRRLLRGLAFAAGLWLLSVSALVWTVQRRVRELRLLRAELARQEQPIVDLERLRQRVRSLSQFTDRSRSALEALRLMAEATPLDGGLRVTDFTYRKDQGVNFSGTSPAGGAAVFSFLEGLSLGGRMKVGKIETKEQRGRSEFQASAEWLWPGDAVAGEEGGQP